jgi:hypothetical protein
LLYVISQREKNVALIKNIFVPLENIANLGETIIQLDLPNFVFKSFLTSKPSNHEDSSKGFIFVIILNKNKIVGGFDFVFQSCWNVLGSPLKQVFLL